jgi:hypothetical protein
MSEQKGNPYYLKDTNGYYYNQYPEFQIWEDAFAAGQASGNSPCAWENAFQAGRKSRDGEIEELQAKLDSEYCEIKSEMLQQAKQEGIQIGRKDVVGWIRDHSRPTAQYMSLIPQQSFTEDWPQQLKEWGLEK